MAESDVGNSIGERNAILIFENDITSIICR
jgi:hypothetical protein